jgi:hypothetical protein
MSYEKLQIICIYMYDSGKNTYDSMFEFVTIASSLNVIDKSTYCTYVIRKAFMLFTQYTYRRKKLSIPGRLPPT